MSKDLPSYEDFDGDESLPSIEDYITEENAEELPSVEDFIEEEKEEVISEETLTIAVSYTHLTLPTTSRV